MQIIGDILFPSEIRNNLPTQAVSLSKLCSQFTELPLKSDKQTKHIDVQTK